MSNIKEVIREDLPEGKVDDISFEGANIVLYTKNKKFFLDDKGVVKSIVDKIKKRIELRPDPSVCIDQEEAEKKIREVLTEEAGIDNIFFDPERSRVVIEVENPGVAIGKNGSNVQKIKEETFWVPIVRRTPAIKSEIINGIRSFLYKKSDERREFLHKTGKRVYDGWIREKKEEWVRVTFLGGGRQVGRSAIFLQTPESRVLLDCGIDVSDTSDSYPHLEAPEFDIKELDAVIVSHAHLDHSGLVPYLFKYGYEGPVYCTSPTRDVMSLLQLDVVKIQRGEGKDPIYTSDEIKKTVKHTICLKYDEVTDITPDVRITFHNAGHILGSGMVHIHIGNGLHNLLYTSDMKYGETSLFSKADNKFTRVESMIIEGTYGGKKNVLPPFEEQNEDFKDVIKKTVDRGGKVLLPSLGSGRAQEVVVILQEMVKEGVIRPDVPLYIDGMVWDITAIHTAYPEFMKPSVKNQMYNKESNPFLADNIQRVGSKKERKNVIEEEGSCIIIATSGMLIGGPSVEYLKKLADNPKNSLIFSCYQASNTLGHRIKSGAEEVSFNQGQKIETVPIKLDVHNLEISGHSDRKELMKFVKEMQPRPRKILVNHGEVSRVLNLASSLYKKYGMETLGPKNLESVRLK